MGIKTQANLIQAFIDKRAELESLQDSAEKAAAESIILEKVIFSDNDLINKIRQGGISTAYGDLSCRSDDGQSLIILKVENSFALDGDLSEEQIKALNPSDENE